MTEQRQVTDDRELSVFHLLVLVSPYSYFETLVGVGFRKVYILHIKPLLRHLRFSL